MLKAMLAKAADGEVICLPPGVYQETLVVDRPVTLVGGGSVLLIGMSDAAIVVTCDAPVVLQGLRLWGSESFAGGVIYATGSPQLTVRNCVLAGGRVAGEGGGIYLSAGHLRLERSLLLHNRAHRGGALACSGTARVDASFSLFWHNHASSVGTALFASDGAELHLTHCTVIGPGDDGGLVAAWGTLSRAPTLAAHNSLLDSVGGCLFHTPPPPTGTHLRLKSGLMGPQPHGAELIVDGVTIGTPTFVDGDPRRGLVPGSPGSATCPAVTSELELDLLGNPSPPASSAAGMPLVDAGAVTSPRPLAPHA